MKQVFKVIIMSLIFGKGDIIYLIILDIIMLFIQVLMDLNLLPIITTSILQCVGTYK